MCKTDGGDLNYGGKGSNGTEPVRLTTPRASNIYHSSTNLKLNKATCHLLKSMYRPIIFEEKDSPAVRDSAERFAEKTIDVCVCV